MKHASLCLSWSTPICLPLIEPTSRKRRCWPWAPFRRKPNEGISPGLITAIGEPVELHHHLRTIWAEAACGDAIRYTTATSSIARCFPPPLAARRRGGGAADKPHARFHLSARRRFSLLRI